MVSAMRSLVSFVFRFVSLLLPALIPSWRFFKDVGPSPRVQFRALENDQTGAWQDVMARPAHVGLLQMLGRLFWNPDWNAYLYSVTCAERLVCEEGNEHARRELQCYVERCHQLPSKTQYQFRVVYLVRAEHGPSRHVIYESPVVPIVVANA